MRKIFTRIFATIGFMVVLSLTISILSGLWYSQQAPKLPERMVLEFDFGSPIKEAIGTNALLSELLGKQALDLRTVILAIDRAAKDPRVAGLYAPVGRTDLSPAQIEEVRAAIKRFVDAGKFAYGWAESFGELGPGNRSYWLASAFSRVDLQPLGLVGLTGAALSQPFAREALDKLGVVPDVHQRYEFKGAMENLSASEIPAPLRENYQTLLNDLHKTMVADIATTRKISVDDLNKLINRAPLLGQDALDGKLIDTLAYADETRKAAQEAGGKGAAFYDLMDYFHASPVPDIEPQNTVALIYALGPIVSRAADTGPLGERDTVNADDLVKAINDASNEPGISTIVIRLDSPGGSATASETIYRAIKQARERGDYVIISMGGTAASGGYWIASAADYVLASPSTLTGSIGVVAGKLVIGPLSDKLGINWSTLTTGTNSGMWAPNTPFTGAALDRVNASLDEIYNAFTKRVMEGRKLTAEQVDKLARGRVWAGSHAKDIGLVDELGGLREAFVVARKHMGLDADTAIQLAPFPRPESREEQILRLLEQFVAAPHLTPLTWSDVGQMLATTLRLPGTQPAGALYYAGPQVMQ